MQSIRRVSLLDKDVAERIAAGEVIERPASVVKELVENALDAGATRIGVDLQNGGVDSIRVTDDGCGMGRDDLSLAVQRFATSKISRWEDLDRLNTYGFRGEALPSVAAISQLEISTRERTADWGWRILLQGGELQRLEEAGIPVGTSILVTDLFYNTPARKKFLKAPVSEAARVQELVAAMSLTAPEVHFTFRHNDKELLDLPASRAEDAVLQRLRKVWTVKREQTFARVEGEGLDGWVSTPDLLWPNRRKLLLFVNRRLVSAPALCHAVSDGVGAGRGRYPLGILSLTVRGDLVDVNVHPTKAEVRFQDNDTIFRLVRQSVARAVRYESPPAPVPFSPPPADWRNAGLEPFAAWPDPVVLPASRTSSGATPGGLGLALVDGKVWVVDPHVYAERRLRRSIEKANAVPLVFPLMLELPVGIADRVRQALPLLRAAAFTLEPFGPATFLVRTVPQGGERLADSTVLAHLLTSHGGEEWVAAFLAEAACRGAWPLGTGLDAELLDRWLGEVENEDLMPAAGAHGRAAMAQLDEARLTRLLAEG